jgi:uncharacterized membrane protein
MNKARLETFSDGVLAIAITLLVLDIRIPEVPYNQLGSAIVHILPKIISYILSFAIIGVYWIGHHYYFKHVRKTNGVFTWLNILLLMLIGFLPFPTSLIGEYPFRTIPILIYGIDLLAINSVSWVMFFYLYQHRELTEDSFTPRSLSDYTKLFLIINGIYLAAIIFSPFWPQVSYVIYILALVWLVITYAKRD